MLHTLKIKNTKPQERAFKLADSGGLYLLIQPNGSKLWRYKFRLLGKEGLQALGSFPEVSLAEARDRHIESRKLVAQGVHPVKAQREHRSAAALAELARDKGSFETAAQSWSDATATALRPATRAQRKREIGNDLLPTLRNRPIKSITRIELTATIKAVEKRAPEVARNLRSYLFGIFEHAIDSGLMEINPVPPQRVLGKRQQTNHAALQPVQLGRFLRVLDEAQSIDEKTRTSMLLVLLTACRKTEVMGARWNEFDLPNLQWEIPATRMKSGRTHWDPLSQQAGALLARHRSTAPEGREFLFPNRRDPLRPMAARTLNALLERLGFSKEGTPHGMRASFSTHFNSLGANADVIEHCLAHAPPNRIRAAYNRHEYQAERRALLQQWADYLDSLRRD